MTAVIYKFNVKPGRSEDFIKAWKEMTELIYEFENSLGSRLHKQDEELYIAYAQWPDIGTWKNAGDRLPDGASELRKKMKESCSTIETLHCLEVVEDLLR